MPNPSDFNLYATSAGPAQFVRGSTIFGTVAFQQGAVVEPGQVYLADGYADCLPILDGGYWRDPAAVQVTECDR